HCVTLSLVHTARISDSCDVYVLRVFHGRVLVLHPMSVYSLFYPVGLYPITSPPHGCVFPTGVLPHGCVSPHGHVSHGCVFPHGCEKPRVSAYSSLTCPLHTSLTSCFTD
ncbi:hypothetical protein OTU49_011671, partial [Cherax quadricarinatus]